MAFTIYDYLAFTSSSVQTEQIHALKIPVLAFPSTTD